MPEAPSTNESIHAPATSARPGKRLGRRALLATGGVVAVYTVSVATHLGEFWPFSIFPMFSRAGRPWKRALLIDVSEHKDSSDWGPWTLEALPGPAVSTRSLGVNTNDLAKFVQLTKVWDEQRITTLRSLCEPALARGATLMLLKAEGKLLADGSVDVSLTPLVRLDSTTATVNAQLSTEAT